MTPAFYMENKAGLVKGWYCVECKNVTQRKRNDSTPVRRQHEVPMDLNMSCDQPEGAEAPPLPLEVASLVQISKLLDRKLGAHHEALSKELAQIRLDFQLSIVTLGNQLSTLTSRIDALEKENTHLHTLIAELHNTDVKPDQRNEELTTLVSQLKTEINEREQDSLQNDIEITCIPESENESTETLIIAIAAKLGVSVEARDIVSSSRAGPRRLVADSSSGAVLRPRPLVVRLARRATRNLFLSSARVRRGATTADLPLPTHKPNRFYVNERLTKTNRALFGKSREVARTSNWKYVWTQDGRVLARKEDKCPVHQIRSDSDIERVFGNIIVRSS